MRTVGAEQGNPKGPICDCCNNELHWRTGINLGTSVIIPLTGSFQLCTKAHLKWNFCVNESVPCASLPGMRDAVSSNSGVVFRIRNLQVQESRDGAAAAIDGQVPAQLGKLFSRKIKSTITFDYLHSHCLLCLYSALRQCSCTVFPSSYLLL